MSSPAATPPARLFTTFGTVLYVDDVGQLRHGPIESSSANVVFMSLGAGSRSGSIMHVTADSQEPVVCFAERCQTVSVAQDEGQSSGPITLELVAVERGLIALRAEGKFLWATPAGRIGLSRPVCSTWECFFASEPWCSAADQDALPPVSALQLQFNVPTIKKFTLSPSSRVAMGSGARLKKVLICARGRLSRSRIYYDLSKQLHRRGFIADLWDMNDRAVVNIDDCLRYYDHLLTSPEDVPVLCDDLGVPPQKLIVVAHDGEDIGFLADEKGREAFDDFAAYGAVSDSAYRASTMLGVRRAPRMVPIGIDFAEFYADVPTKLESVGYASAMSYAPSGIELKRGRLAEASAQDAGLRFTAAGSPGQPMSLHEMPSFYSSVDAVLMPSLSETVPLPVMEAAASGRLVIGTPVGDFALKAYQGGGIIAPIEPEAFVAFAATTLKHYKDRPADFVFKCLAIQESARRFDWAPRIGAWADLIEGA